MKSTLNTSVVLVVSAVFILLSPRSFAQPRGMTMNQVYSQVNKQTMNQQMQMNMQMQMLSLNNAGSYNPNYTYDVTMTDGTMLQVTSRILSDTTLKKTYLLIVDKRFKKSDTTHRFQRIYPFQTKIISRIDDTPGAPAITGLPTDSCWMFKIISGAINVYSLLSVEDDEQIFDPSSIVGIQLNDGPIVKYNADNLKPMVGQDTKALELIGDKNLYRAIKRFNRDAKKAAKEAAGTSGAKVN